MWPVVNQLPIKEALHIHNKTSADKGNFERNIIITERLAGHDKGDGKERKSKLTSFR